MVAKKDVSPTVQRLVKGKLLIQLCIRDPFFRLETTMKKCRHSDVANERFVKFCAGLNEKPTVYLKD